MKDIPVTFSPAMIIALRGGWKTVTRRAATSRLAKNAKPGGRLWVRESFKGGVGKSAHLPFVYRVDAPMGDTGPWHPGYSMPKARSRFTLEVVGVTIQALHNFDERDAFQEGVRLNGDGYWDIQGAPIPRGEEYTYYYSRDPVETFRLFWDVLNGRGAWNENPDIAAITFKVVL